jgi:hypothetical protein
MQNRQGKSILQKFWLERAKRFPAPFNLTPVADTVLRLCFAGYFKK